MRKILYAAVGIALAAGIATPMMAMGADSTTVVVTGADLTTTTAPGPNQFAVIDQKNGGGSGGGVSTVPGPATAPLNKGSLQLAVAGTADHWSVYNYDHTGTLLSDITALSYSTYTDNTTTAPAMQLEINPGVPAASCTGCVSGKTYSTLNFEPYQNTSQGLLAAGTWQGWNVLNGTVWGTNLNMGQGPGVSWSQFIANYPNATVKYGFGVNVGGNWSAMTGNVDALTFGTAAGTTTYDFEPTVALSGKDQCKQGGWLTSNAPTFMNQGACVSYFASNGNAHLNS